MRSWRGARLKSIIERALYSLPRLHSALLVRRPVPDLNKLVWVSIIRRGQIVLDVGANRGHYTEFFSYKVGRRGRVYAFEPVQESADALRRRCSGFQNACVFQVALSDEIARKRIFIPGDDLQQASLARQSDGSWSKCERVDHQDIDLVTLDSWVVQHGLERIDFIKMDVEGAEYKVLRGGSETLRRFRPLIHMEVCRDWLRGFGIDLGDLAREVASLGYNHVYRPVIEDRRFRLEPADLRRMENGDVLVSSCEI